MSHDKSTLDKLRIDRSAAPVRGKPWVWWAAAFLVIGAAGVGWWLSRPKTVHVKTATARETTSGGQRTLLNGSGYVTARREATVSSKVTGKVIEVLVEEGMRVEAGQVLARIDSSNVEASLRLADAQLALAHTGLKETQVRLHEAERELVRVNRLESENIATQADLDRAEAEVKSLNARLEQQAAQVTVAEREVALWKQQMEDTVVRAPFAGVVTAKNAQPGEMISPMSAGGSFTRTGICTIVDMSSLEIEVEVNEAYINRVESGQPVLATLDSYPDWKIPAKVIAIIPTANRQNATVTVRVGFEELDPRILPHMVVKVAFQSNGEGDAGPRILTVPKGAVWQADGRDYVWVVNGGRIERRAITVTRGGKSDDVTIAAGLSAGEMVVVNGPSDLVEGTRVKQEQ